MSLPTSTNLIKSISKMQIAILLSPKFNFYSLFEKSDGTVLLTKDPEFKIRLI